MIAIQSVSNGVKGIANELTTKGTAANKLFAFSQLQLKTVCELVDGLDVVGETATRVCQAGLGDGGDYPAQ